MANNWLFLHKLPYSSKALRVTLHESSWGLITGNAMGLIVMTILIPTFFRRLDINKAEVEMSSRQSHVLIKYIRRISAWKSGKGELRCVCAGHTSHSFSPSW